VVGSACTCPPDRKVCAFYADQREAVDRVVGAIDRRWRDSGMKDELMPDDW
jgi:hypothetical protein